MVHREEHPGWAFASVGALPEATSSGIRKQASPAQASEEGGLLGQRQGPALLSFSAPGTSRVSTCVFHLFSKFSLQLLLGGGEKSQGRALIDPAQ